MTKQKCLFLNQKENAENNFISLVISFLNKWARGCNSYNIGRMKDWLLHFHFYNLHIKQNYVKRLAILFYHHPLPLFFNLVINENIRPKPQLTLTSFYNLPNFNTCSLSTPNYKNNLLIHIS